MIYKHTLQDFPRPAWLPDWTDPGAYPKHGKNAKKWAWEFLRRNPEYQSDYAHCMSVPGYFVETGHTPKWSGSRYDDDSEMIYFYVDSTEPPAAGPGEKLGDYRRRTGIEPLQLVPGLLRKWKIYQLIDPAENSPSGFFPGGDSAGTGAISTPPYLPPYLAGRLDPVWPKEDDPFIQMIAFDLRRPLGGQLELAARMLDLLRGARRITDSGVIEKVEEVRLPAPRLDDKLMQSYLRVFDAVWAIGWKRQQIAATIWPKKKRSVDDRSGLSSTDAAIKKALELVNGDYLPMLLWANFPKNLNK